ncbi:MAG: hypothetical protein CM15mP78_16300 [Candidatus Poseidoniales archaeon]|nr:MAG: hypothetical protein CM15mP78_16300 [Candidatus Poseidoniales archaeon]
MFSMPCSGSMSRPKAVGLMLMLASKSLALMAFMTRMYSSRKKVASSMDEISSPRTSMVKQAPSALNRFMTATASSSVEPAT